MSDGEVHIEIDPMLFYAAFIEDNLAIVRDAQDAGNLMGMSGLGDLMAEAAHRDIAAAQTELDRLIAEDHTWSSSEWCAMEYEGNDPEDGDYYRCTVHGRLVLGDAYVCEGYTPPPYVEGKGRS